jgi:molecular chaperone DnaK (HSP70)
VRLGIDFGTTHTVVALVDRGNYPVVSFEGADSFPSVVAGNARGDVRFGPDALEVRQKPGWELLRSFKRLLSDAGPLTRVELAGRPYLLGDLFVNFLARLRQELVEKSNAGIGAREPLEVSIGVPANAGSTQRFLTLDAFQRVGFKVTAFLNEPSAAGIEYAHRYRNTITSHREYVAIYDLGGGTFDASLLKMTGRASEVVTSEGVQRLGGDDFDEAILSLVLEKSRVPPPAAPVRTLLLEECARQKEAMNPNSRRMVLDLSAAGAGPVSIPVEEVFAACSPLVVRTLEAMKPVFVDPQRPGDETVDWAELAGIYIVGGAGAFPLIPRLLRETYGERRVKRSPHAFAATAIGLAILLDREAGYTVTDRLSRTFGVFRELESGEGVSFDPIFGNETTLPALGEPPLTTARRYLAVHNIGHFRFVECSRVSLGRPEGDIAPWDAIRFPFDPALRGSKHLKKVKVERIPGPGREVEERYSCLADGTVEVTLTDLSDGFSKSYRLGRATAAAD